MKTPDKNILEITIFKTFFLVLKTKIIVIDQTKNSNDVTILFPSIKIIRLSDKVKGFCFY